MNMSLACSIPIRIDVNYPTLRPYSKNKLELNSKKSNSSRAKILNQGLYLTFFCTKAELQKLKFEFYQSTWDRTTEKFAVNWQNFG